MNPENKRKRSSAREIAADVLVQVEQAQAYSNMALNEALRKHELKPQDAALATELVYGTIQRLNTIDYYLSSFVQTGLKKLKPLVRALLRLSFYQLYYLDRIPDHAVVSEAVTIAKKRGYSAFSGFVNGVLRSVIRRKSELVLPEDAPAVQRLSLLHSHPEWMVRRWIQQYGEQTAERICEANNRPPRVSLRVNTLKRTRDEMMALLHAEGVDVRPSTWSEQGILVSGAGNMALTRWYEAGDFSVQDESSMLVATLVAPLPGMSVLDCCAAPGGKTAHMAELMGGRGRIVAADIHPHKEKLIQDQAARLGITCIETAVSDARQLGETWPEASFDCILLDAPCSGLGVIRRKPDLKWRKSEQDIRDITALQQDILASVHRLLKPGGRLVYSTCTLASEENRDQAESFLLSNKAFSLDISVAERVPSELADKQPLPPGMVEIFPDTFESDGFFIACFKKSDA